MESPSPAPIPITEPTTHIPIAEPIKPTKFIETEMMLVKLLSGNEELKKQVKYLMKENKELNGDFIFKFNNFYKKILNIIIILTIIIVCVYLNDIYNKYNLELTNINTYLIECNSQLSEIDSLHYICKENLKDSLNNFAEYKLAENNQVDLYDKNKKGSRCFSLFSINIGG
jgi:hypothetical protein